MMQIKQMMQMMQIKQGQQMVQMMQMMQGKQTLRFNGPVRAQVADGNRGGTGLPSAGCARTSRTVIGEGPDYRPRFARGQGR